jgi:hypothetical protein
MALCSTRRRQTPPHWCSSARIRIERVAVSAPAWVVGTGGTHDPHRLMAATARAYTCAAIKTTHSLCSIFAESINIMGLIEPHRWPLGSVCAIVFNGALERLDIASTIEGRRQHQIALSAHQSPHHRFVGSEVQRKLWCRRFVVLDSSSTPPFCTRNTLQTVVNKATIFKTQLSDTQTVS